ncbi:MAG: tRNA (adenosine(37)-N6)-threonylcarbamoyltransferase complex ATPase subunit type 1 TsaE [Lachnospiraceae bacterium]|nr:tRNA (adenosine(37)-N6)-threonylcarbamoyltransferase complex ATPase subunit type 1 TsaE [Lachnospiraceae bacterium]
MTIETYSPEETFALGEKLGAKARRSQVFALLGDLGVGKTLFAQGFAKGFGIQDIISSPTFTIIQEYQEGHLPFYHFDVYRIGDVAELEEIGFEEYVYGDGVVLVEWANLILEAMPQVYTEITIIKDVSQGFDYRKIVIQEINETGVKP